MFRRNVIYGLFCLLVVFAVSCDDDCPTCPPPSTEPVSDYDVYLSGLGNSPVFKYNTKSMTIVDTLYFDNEVSDIGLSGDGRHLIVAFASGIYQFVVYDLETMDTVLARLNANLIEVSNTGKYIAVFTGGSIQFLDGDTYDILFGISANIDGGRFLLDDSKFYCLDPDNNIRIYDMAAQALDTMLKYVDDEGYSPEIYGLQPTALGDKLYFYVTYPPFGINDSLIAYSIADDSNSLSFYSSPLGGEMNISPDGKQIIITHCGNPMIDLFGPMNVIFIDPENDAFISIVPAGRANQGIPITGMMPCCFAVTPDSRYTIVASAAGASAFGMIDNETHQFVDLHIYQLQTASFMQAACQKQIK